MKKIIKKISGAIQVILVAPIQLPGKFIHIIKYIGLGLGIIESVITDKDEQVQNSEEPDCKTTPAQLLSDGDDLVPPAKESSESKNVSGRVIRYDLETGKEVSDETE